MKKIFRTTFALAAIAAFASCAEQIDNPGTGNADTDTPLSEQFVPMTFSTSSSEEIEVKTTYGSDGVVLWEETDQISVFSQGSESVNSKGTKSAIAEDGTWIQFTALADPSAETYYAVYPYSENNACSAEGALTVTLQSAQTAVAGGFMSGANTSVAYSEATEEGTMLQFKNVTSLICFGFNTADEASTTAYVTFKAKKNETEYWGLSGSAQVSFNSNNEPVVGEGDVEYVRLNAPEGGFEIDVVYYIPVYSVGECTGWEVTYVGTDGLPSKKTNSLTSTLSRNTLFEIGAIPEPCVLELKVDFTGGCPFVEGNYVAAADQDCTNGDVYTYRYSYDLPDGTSGTKDFTFKLYARSAELPYSHYGTEGKEGLLAGTGTGKNNCNLQIQIPAVSGMYLSKVQYSTAKYPSVANYRMVLSNKLNGGTVTSAGGSGSQTWTFPYLSGITQVQSELGKSFVVRGRDACIIKTLTFTYTKTKPE